MNKPKRILSKNPLPFLTDDEMYPIDDPFVPYDAEIDLFRNAHPELIFYKRMKEYPIRMFEIRGAKYGIHIEKPKKEDAANTLIIRATDNRFENMLTIFAATKTPGALLDALEKAYWFIQQ